MTALRYQYGGDGRRGNAHELLLDAVGTGKRVLDVGCASGYLAEQLARRDCRVVGIEIDPDAAALARRHCGRVIVGAADDPAALQAAGNSFDVILCGDVLEHMQDPSRPLRAFAAMLAPDGRLLVSLPNIAYIRIRLDLLLGRFEYEESGILDRTHLRFFTLTSARRFFRDCGWRETAFQPAAGRFPRGIVRLWPTLFAPQFVFQLVPAERAAP